MADTAQAAGSETSEAFDEERDAALLEEVLATSEDSIFRKLILARGQAGTEETKQLLILLAKQSLDGTVVWNKNLTDTINHAVARLDQKVSEQLRKVYQNSALREIEGRWLGLQKLVRNTEVGTDLKIKLIDISKKEMLQQFDDAPAVDRSPFFNIVYQHEFGTAGGEPYGLMLGDYSIGFSGQDVALMRYLGEVAAASHSPLIMATKPSMFGLPDYRAFSEGRPIAPGFDAPTYADWNDFRNSNDSHYVVLTLPRSIARLPYGEETCPVDRFNFEEMQRTEDGLIDNDPDRDFVWSNACFEMGLRMTESFSKYGWCTAVRGLENGGKVENLANYTYTSEAGDIIQQCPVEVNITDEQEKELSDLGFLPLVHWKGQSFAVFIGGQTTQRPKEYTNPDATANAAISARLPYVMASSRIAHYIKMIGRDKLGSNVTAQDVQKIMSDWLAQYTNPNAIGNDARAKYPLSESNVSVVEQPGRPGCYSAVAYLKPWLQMEELSASVRTVASIPG